MPNVEINGWTYFDAECMDCGWYMKAPYPSPGPLPMVERSADAHECPPKEES